MAADIRAGRAFVELFVKDSAFFQHINAAGKRLNALGEIAVSMGTRLGAAGLAVLGPLMAATKHFASAGSELKDMADRTGLSAENLSALGYAAGMTGANLEDVERALRFMQKQGISADALGDIADQMAATSDATERTKLAIDTFGKAGTALIPMLSGGRDGLAEFREEAERLGLIMSTADAEAADSLGDSLDRLKGSVQGVSVRIGATLAPLVQDAADALAGLVSGVREWVSTHGELVQTIAKVAAGVTLAGGAFIALGGALIGAGAILTSISTIAGTAATAIAFLLSPVGLVAGGIVAAAVATYKFRDSLGGVGGIVDATADRVGSFASAVASDMRGMGANFDTAWAGIVDAVQSGDLALAGQIAMAGLKAMWARGTAALNELWLSAKFFALETWESFKAETAQIFVAMFAGIENAWVKTTAFIESTWSKVTETLGNAWNKAQLGIGKMLIAAAEQSGAVSKEFADAWRQSLEEPIKAGMADRSQRAANQRAEITRRRNAELKGIEDRAAGTVGILDEDRQRALAALRRARSGEAADRDKEIADAEAALAGLRGKAREGREARGDRRAEGTEGMPGKGGVAVTFSAAGLAALGGGAGGYQAKTYEELREARKQRHEQLEAAKRTTRILERVEVLLVTGGGTFT